MIFIRGMEEIPLGETTINSTALIGMSNNPDRKRPPTKVVSFNKLFFWVKHLEVEEPFPIDAVSCSLVRIPNTP